MNSYTQRIGDEMELFRNKKALNLSAFLCDPDWIRTNDLLLRRQLLYPAELPDQIFFMYSLPEPPFRYFSRSLASILEG